MSWIKRTLVGFLIVVLLIIVGSYGVIFYRQNQAAKICIPSNTQRLVKIEFDRMLAEIAKNAVFNYSSYFGQLDSSDSPVSLKLWETGVRIPSTCYFYALEDSRHLYGHFKIRDKALLIEFLTEKLGFERDSSSVLESYVRPNLHAMLNEDEITIGIGKTITSEDLKIIVEGERDSWVSVGEFGFALDSTRTSDLAYLDREGNWFGMDFKPGEALLSGRLESSYLSFPNHPRGSEKMESDILYLYLNTDLNQLLPKIQQRIGDSNLPLLDDLGGHLGNYIDFRLGTNQILQTDTIISYDYDENFDMIEMETLQETVVPELNVRMMASPHLLDQLPEKVFYQFHKRRKNGLVELSTSKDGAVSNPLDSTDAVFSVIYQKSDRLPRLPIAVPEYLKTISSAQLNGIRHGHSEMKMHGILKFQSPQLHALYQFLSNR